MALDMAVADNMDVLSLSLGDGLEPYYRDNILLNAFGAMEKGIFMSCLVGNGGLDLVSRSNVVSCIATIGAGTLDRDFLTYVELDNGLNFIGVSLYHDCCGLSLDKKVP